MSGPKRLLATLIAVTVTLGLVSRAEATLIEIYDKTTFLTSTGASSLTGALPDLGSVGVTTTISGTTISISAPSSTLYVGAAGVGIGGDWYGPLAGNDIAISDSENLNFDLPSPVFSFGFDFVEPGSSTMPPWGGAAVDSTFEVTLKSAGLPVGFFSFNRPEDVVGFVGVWTDFSFDRVEIREAIGGIDDEYFGEAYAGTTPVPEPTILWLLGSGLSALALRRRVR